MASYSPVLLDHFQSPRNMGVLDDATAIGQANLPGRSVYLRLFVRIRSDAIEQATFQASGCGPLIATGSFITEWMRSKRPSDCLALSVDELDAALGNLPEEKRFCLGLALLALRDAVGTNPSQEGTNQHTC